MSEPELTPDEEDFIAGVKAALRERRAKGSQVVNYRTAEQIDLAIAAALERRSKQRWEQFWKLLGKTAMIVGLVAGLTVIAANTGFWGRETPSSPARIETGSAPERTQDSDQGTR